MFDSGRDSGKDSGSDSKEVDFSWFFCYVCGFMDFKSFDDLKVPRTRCAGIAPAPRWQRARPIQGEELRRIS